MVHREPLPRSPEPAHDLVGDQHDPVAGAELSHAFEVAVGRDQDPVRAGDGLEDERRDRLRTLELDRLLERRERRRRGLRPTRRPAVRIQHVDDPGHRRVLVRPPTRIAGQVDRGVGGSVVRAVASQDLLPPRERLRDPDRVLVRLGAAQGEEGLLQVAGPERGELLPEPGARLVRHERRDVGELLRLPRDRVGHALVPVPDVHAHQLRVEVEVPLVVDVPEVDALRPVHRDRGGLRLGLPVVERVALRLLDDLGGGQRLDFGHRSAPRSDAAHHDRTSAAS